MSELNVDPRLWKYADWWLHLANVLGDEEAELQQAYCVYTSEFSGPGRPLRFDDWLAAQQDYAADWDTTDGHMMLVLDALQQEFDGDGFTELLSAYRGYAHACRASRCECLEFADWIMELAHVAGLLDEPPAIVDSHDACDRRRPHLRYAGCL